MVIHIVGTVCVRDGPASPDARQDDGVMENAARHEIVASPIRRPWLRNQANVSVPPLKLFLT